MGNKKACFCCCRRLVWRRQQQDHVQCVLAVRVLFGWETRILTDTKQRRVRSDPIDGGARGGASTLVRLLPPSTPRKFGLNASTCRAIARRPALTGLPALRITIYKSAQVSDPYSLRGIYKLGIGVPIATSTCPSARGATYAHFTHCYSTRCVSYDCITDIHYLLTYSYLLT